MTKTLTDAAARAGLERVAELATGMAAYASQIGRDGLTAVQRMHSLSGPIKSGQNNDGIRGNGELWCFEHQGNPEGPHGCGCKGERILWHDPTGDAAIRDGDPATADLLSLGATIREAERLLEDALRIFGRWPGPRDPSLFDMDATEGCFAHRRIGTFREPHARREVQPGQVYRLCKWCAYQWFDAYGVLPTEAILKAHDSGQGRLRVREDGAVIHAGQVIDHVQLKQEANA